MSFAKKPICRLLYWSEIWSIITWRREAWWLSQYNDWTMWWATGVWLLGRGRKGFDSSFRQRIQIDSGAHTALYPMCTGNLSPGSK